MRTLAFFDAKPYDKVEFDKLNESYNIKYIEYKLNADTAPLAKGCEAVCAFVNDDISADTLETLYNGGTKVLAMRCAGFSNIDLKAAYEKINVVRVPAYSPYAVAEFAMALLQMLNRHLHKAYNRTRDFNFSINGLTGIDLYGKTAGIIGTGKIGRVMLDICRGYGMKTIAYDPYPAKDSGIEYVGLDKLFEESDVISLHCPLTKQTYRIIGKEAFSLMKKRPFIVNTSRGQLIDSDALLDALNAKTVRGACLDVYEEEADIFYEDYSGEIINDDTLSLLLAHPNVVITSHQAYLTEEALNNIAKVTLGNLDAFFSDKPLENEVCYRCEEGRASEKCRHGQRGRCF